MALSAGDKPGPCEIIAPISSGGMGEVFRAWDSRLDRVVAIYAESAKSEPRPQSTPPAAEM